MWSTILRYRFFCIILGVSAALVIASCTDFFSTSLFPWAARDPNSLIPTLTAQNIDDLLKLAENDPNLSLALLKKIQSAKNGMSVADQQKLMNASLQAAVNAAGLGQSVLGAAGSLATIDFKAADATDQAKNAVLNAVGSLSNLDAASQALLGTLPQPGSNPAAPSQEFIDWAKNANPDDMAMAAVVLVAGGIGNISDTSDEGIKEYLDGLSNKTETPENLALALAIATQLEGRKVSGPLGSVLEGLQLLGTS